MPRAKEETFRGVSKIECRKNRRGNSISKERISCTVFDSIGKEVGGANVTSLEVNRGGDITVVRAKRRVNFETLADCVRKGRRLICRVRFE